MSVGHLPLMLSLPSGKTWDQNFQHLKLMHSSPEKRVVFFKISPVTHCKRHIEYMIFWPPQKKNIAVRLSIFSHVEKVIVRVRGDVSVLLDPEIIADELQKLCERDFCM